jgi:hypothetical protein
MIYKEITQSDFTAEFHRCGRGDQFSHVALLALYDYLLEMSDADNPYELDVIALCCEFGEDAVEDVLSSYNLETIEELRDKTTVVWEGEGRVLYVQF